MVFDYGYGGELLADQIEEQMPIIQVLRVIDWRHAKEYESNSHQARRCAKNVLRPYIGRVDLIIIANHFVSVTSLKYFQRKYKNQKFIGLRLAQLDSKTERDIIILTTKAMYKTINYHNYIFRLKRKTKTLILDSWTAKIDEGELDNDDIKMAFAKIPPISPDGKSTELVLACAHFSDLKPLFKKHFGRNIKIHDSFDDAIRQACKALRLRGGTGKK